MTRTRKTSLATLILSACLLSPGLAQAHCDTLDGPVIPEAKMALKKGDITPILKWVKQADEPEIRAAFSKAVTVRGKGGEAADLADRYFLETLVRVHRAGEGAPYTGLKDEAVEPVVALADNALANGSAEDMIRKISDHMAREIHAKFQHALETQKNKGKSVEAGREFVEAYVTYVHYVEGVHKAIEASGAHQHAASAPAPVAAMATQDHHNH